VSTEFVYLQFAFNCLKINFLLVTYIVEEMKFYQSFVVTCNNKNIEIIHTKGRLSLVYRAAKMYFIMIYGKAFIPL